MVLLISWYSICMEEQHKQTVIHYYDEAWNNNNVSVVDEVFKPDYIVENLPPWREPGAAGLKAFLADNHRMFADIRLTIDDILAEGDKVAVRFSTTAKHVGDLNGPVGLVPATNKIVTWRGFAIFTFENGKVVKTAGASDNMSLMQQLGAVPMPNK